MLKKGAIAAGSGIIAIMCSFLFAFGPCGPASMPGMILYNGGILAVLAGFGVTGIGLLVKLARYMRKPTNLET